MTMLRTVPLFLVFSAFLPTAHAASPSSADDRTAALVRARLLQPDAAETIHVSDVAVADGTVIITGSARTRYARAAAVRVVGEVAGVRHVDARLRVEPNP
jgi:osmotically-inducible protein OsmY